MWLTAKCYLVQNEALNKNKYSCKGVPQEHNDPDFQRYKNVLDFFLKTRRDSQLEEKHIDNIKNVGFRVYGQGVVTYELSKLGLSRSGYYDKRYVLGDRIHTRPLDFSTSHQRCFFIAI